MLTMTYRDMFGKPVSMSRFCRYYNLSSSSFFHNHTISAFEIDKFEKNMARYQLARKFYQMQEFSVYSYKGVKIHRIGRTLWFGSDMINSTSPLIMLSFMETVWDEYVEYCKKMNER